MQRTLYPYDVFFRQYPRGYGAYGSSGGNALTVRSVVDRIVGLIDKAEAEAEAGLSPEQKERYNAMGEKDPRGTPKVSYKHGAVAQKAQVKAMAMTAEKPEVVIPDIFDKTQRQFENTWGNVAPRATQEFKDYIDTTLAEIQSGTYTNMEKGDLDTIEQRLQKTKAKIPKVWYEKPTPYVIGSLILVSYFAIRIFENRSKL